MASKSIKFSVVDLARALSATKTDSFGDPKNLVFDELPHYKKLEFIEEAKIVFKAFKWLKINAKVVYFK